MKKNFIYALMSAIAVVGAVSFTACSSSDEIVDNPNYNPVDNTVKTQFTISVTNKAGSGTRMSEAVVQGQATPTFRGLDQMVLIPYGKVTSGDVDGNRLAAGITLNVSGGTANTLPSFQHPNSNSYVYSDVNIPLGTYGFLFYGKAIDATAGTLITTPVDKFTYGYLTPSDLTGEKASFGFSLDPIAPTTTTSSIAGPLLDYVKSIAAATGWATAENAAIKGLYTNFITMKAGSSTSIRAALEDLYESLMNNADDVSKAVCTAILSKATYSATANSSGEKLVFDSRIAGYPADINLPDGAVALTWSAATPAVPSWMAAETTATPSGGTWNTGTADFTGLDKYVFPASLYYRANSPVVVSNKKESDNYGSKTWTEITNTSTGLYTNGDNVNSSTQSVAIVEPIQYAVALLESHVKIAATTLKDRKGDDIKIGTDATDDGTFKLTGILIGGQKNVDWQFLPTTATGASIYTIYDKDIPSASDANVLSLTSSDATNYTLALENAENESVYVALEFENNAKDFMGKDGLIAKGTKFYLVAQLDPTDKTGDGHTATGDLNKVFKQDYKTIVTFKIKENTIPQPSSDPEVYPDGLGAAYNVIPDLRTPKMELGLSVNLEWQRGLEFVINL